MSEAERKARILSMIDPAGRGLEIGPSHNPVAPKSSGFQVHTVDHADQTGLIEKYRGHNVNLAAIEPVDYVWTGGSLFDVIASEGYYDWIIASHVIEHLPNLIGFIKDCQRLLRPGGVLALAVPDKRFCFDYLRWPTSTGETIQAHLDDRRRHTAGQVFDSFSKACRLDLDIAWERGRGGVIDFMHGEDFGPHMFSTYLGADEYVDIHAWVFTPSSFRLVIRDLNALGLLSIREMEFIDTIGCEFLVSLANEPSQSLPRRIDLAKAAIEEVRDVFFP